MILAIYDHIIFLSFHFSLTLFHVKPISFKHRRRRPSTTTTRRCTSGRESIVLHACLSAASLAEALAGALEGRRRRPPLWTLSESPYEDAADVIVIEKLDRDRGWDAAGGGDDIQRGLKVKIRGEAMKLRFESYISS